MHFNKRITLIVFFVEAHISHLRDKPEEEVNRLLRMVVDIDNMGTAMSREENPETKKVYTHLFYVCSSHLLDIINQMRKFTMYF